MGGRKRLPPAADAPAARRAWAELLDARCDELGLSIDAFTREVNAAGLAASRSVIESWRRRVVPPVERWPVIAKALRYDRFRDFVAAWAERVEATE